MYIPILLLILSDLRFYIHISIEVKAYLDNIITIKAIRVLIIYYSTFLYRSMAISDMVSVEVMKQKQFKWRLAKQATSFSTRARTLFTSIRLINATPVSPSVNEIDNRK